MQLDAGSRLHQESVLVRWIALAEALRDLQRRLVEAGGKEQIASLLELSCSSPRIGAPRLHQHHPHRLIFHRPPFSPAPPSPLALPSPPRLRTHPRPP